MKAADAVAQPRLNHPPPRCLGFNTSCDNDDIDCDDDVSGTEWSGIVGADAAIYLGAVSLWADGRYHVGLNDIADTDTWSCCSEISILLLVLDNS